MKRGAARAGVALVASVVALGGCRKERGQVVADAGADPSASTTTSPQVDARSTLTNAKVPGIGYVAVTSEREAVAAGQGFADVERHVDATADTVFEAASIAKLVIVTCVMQLVEEKKLALDEDVGKYVGFPVRHPRWTEPITLRLLLTHFASIRDRPEAIGAVAAGNPLGVFLRSYFVSGETPRADAFLAPRPGRSMTYSNVGAALAAFAVEHVSDESFVDVSARRVFKPLGMSRTGWTALGSKSDVLATPHRWRDDGFAALPQASHAIYPVVDLRSSARDLGRFARAILREGELDGARVLSAESVRTMTGRPTGEPLAWQHATLAGKSVTGHEGEDDGASTGLFLDVAAGTGVVVLANGDAFGSGDPKRIRAMQSLLADLLAAAR